MGNSAGVGLMTIKIEEKSLDSDKRYQSPLRRVVG
ncbi:hypothetical protein PAHA111176_05575 [Parendozoicomonas haliclonae]|uniref:Uncharacterized protein n=1 Tax=Parendozoicomonas haliclonae TaxID=1960125 RepID=A0A1X7AMR1_9GAMM|nr:hypothetical protein EHSB41UT_02477 [Parendozoicomonas haliclonae]